MVSQCFVDLKICSYGLYQFWKCCVSHTIHVAIYWLVSNIFKSKSPACLILYPQHLEQHQRGAWWIWNEQINEWMSPSQTEEVEKGNIKMFTWMQVNVLLKKRKGINQVFYIFYTFHSGQVELLTDS